MRFDFFRTMEQLFKKIWRDRNTTCLSDQDIAAALERGRIAAATEPRAVAAWYDVETDRIGVKLKDGSTFAFSPRTERGLEMATAEELAEVEILGTGSGLHWESLDVDISVPGLAAQYTQCEAISH